MKKDNEGKNNGERRHRNNRKRLGSGKAAAKSIERRRRENGRGHVGESGRISRKPSKKLKRRQISEKLKDEIMAYRNGEMAYNWAFNIALARRRRG
jgi:hypothetical protein